MYVGDEPRDVMAAMNAGYGASVAVATGPASYRMLSNHPQYRADFVIRSMSELIGLLERLKGDQRLERTVLLKETAGGEGRPRIRRAALQDSSDRRPYETSRDAHRPNIACPCASSGANRSPIRLNGGAMGGIRSNSAGSHSITPQYI